MLPFTWVNETTSLSFDEEARVRFLKRHGVFKQGLWIRECEERNEKHEYGELDSDDYVLPSESCLLESNPPAPLQHVLEGWQDYYEWRTFRIDSPLCVLMQWSLTIYHVLTRCLRTDYSIDVMIDKCKPVIIHIVGVEKEADLCATFQELENLLPDLTFDIHLIGPFVSKRCDGRLKSKERVSITLHRGLYHCLTFNSSPTLVIEALYTDIFH